MKKLKGFILACLFLFWLTSAFVLAQPPTFDADKKLWYADSFDVSSKKSLEENIYSIFFPLPKGVGWGNVLFNKIRFISVWLAILFIIRWWAMFILNADDENELKKAKLNMLYILYGGFLIFWAAWILWDVLKVWLDNTNATNTVVATQNKIIWFVLIFFKALAYYAAIILMVYYWVQIMKAQEKEDKIKAGKTWVINIILALIAIKVLDYIYYIAQNKSFVQTGWSFISGAGKVLGWVLWVVIVLALLYSAVLLITSRWNEESWKKAKTIVRNVFLVIFVLFLFIVIVFDLFKNFSG